MLEINTMWYYNKKGRAYGPVESEAIEEMVRSGELGHLDLLFREGESEWLPVNSVDEFKSALDGFQLNVKRADKDVLQNWVILKTINTPDGLQYQQQGPFSEEQVKELVERGAFKFSDYIWKPGFQTWRRIREIPEFSKPLPSSMSENTVYESGDDATNNSFADKSELSQLIEIDYDTKIVKKSGTGKAPSQTPPATPYFDLDPVPDEVSTDDMTRDQIKVDPPKTNIDQLILPDQIKKQSKANLIPEIKKNAEKKHDNISKAKAKKNSEHLKTELKINKPVPDTEKIDKAMSQSEEKTEVTSHSEAPGSMIWYYVAAVILVCAGAMLVFYNSLRAQRINSEGIEVSEPVSLKPIEDLKPTNIEPKQIAPPQPVTSSVKPMQEPIKESKSNTTDSVPEVSGDHVIDKDKELKPQNSKQGVYSSLKNEKQKSYYLSRDRKALMYSSLKASRLASELEKFAKNNRDTASWKKFYSRWNLEINSAPAKLVAQYKPSRSGDYALPSEMSDFNTKLNELKLKSKEINKQMLTGQKPSVDIKSSSKGFYSIYKSLQNQ